MFRLDHRRDFDAILEASSPFALVRFGDGEAAILSNQKHIAANEEWISDGSDHWIRPSLFDSLQRISDGFCIGVPSSCCLRGSMGIIDSIRTPDTRRTFATLFLHGNLTRFGEIMALRPVTVAHHGDIEVPRTAMDRGADLDPIVRSMQEIDRPMVVSAGPLANVLIDLYWQRQDPARRQTVLDVGSALDFHLSGRPTRQYHRGTVLDHHCSMTSEPLVAGRSAPRATTIERRTMAVSTRNSTIIGRSAPRHPQRASVQTVANSGSRRTSTVSSSAPTTPAASPSASTGPSVGAPGQQGRKCAKCVRIVRSRR